MCVTERNTVGSVLETAGRSADRARVSKRGRGAAEFGIWNLFWRGVGVVSLERNTVGSHLAQGRFQKIVYLFGLYNL